MPVIMSTHKPALDELTPAEIRVVCEQLLYTMPVEQRVKLRETYPGLYAKVEPVHGKLNHDVVEVQRLTLQAAD